MAASAIKTKEDFTAVLATIGELAAKGAKTAEDFAVLAGHLDDAHKYAVRAAKLCAKIEAL